MLAPTVQDAHGTAIAGGGAHSLAVLTGGPAYGWGRNFTGQLGDGTTTSRSVPVQVSGLTSAKWVAAGTYHTYVENADGSAVAFGWNGLAQLGDGTRDDHATPVIIAGAGGVATTGVGGLGGGGLMGLVATPNGTVYSWGDDYYGQLGDGTTTNHQGNTRRNSRTSGGFSRPRSGKGVAKSSRWVGRSPMSSSGRSD